MLQVRLLFISAIIFITSFSALPQGQYLEKGESGFNIGGVFSNNRESSGIGGAAGYTFDGFLDIVFFVGQFALKDQLMNNDVTTTAVSPAVTFHVLKETAKTL